MAIIYEVGQPVSTTMFVMQIITQVCIKAREVQTELSLWTF